MTSVEKYFFIVVRGARILLVNKLRRISVILTIVAVVLSAVVVPKAFAVRVDSLKDVISDSRPSTAANHTISIDMSSGTSWAASETLTVSLNSSTFDTTGFASSDAVDYDIVVGGTEETMVVNGGCGASDAIEITTVNTTTDTFTFTTCGSYTVGSTGALIVIEIGTNATAGGTGNTQIVNATSQTTTTLTVAGNYGDDSQDTILVTTSGVTVSATMDEVLTMTVAAVVSGSCTTLGGTKITSTATTIPYATISTETFYDICQQLTVATNAGTGYSVTVYTIAGLDSGANAFGVGNCDGGGSPCSLVTPSTWATATNNGYAICMDDSSGNAATTANAAWVSGTNQCGDGTQKFELVADLSGAQAPSSIMASATPVTDVSLISWRLSADGAQAAGAYTGTADYITTGTF